ncbi:MAG: mechanosensitive ion channel [Chitinophagales bacterium]
MKSFDDIKQWILENLISYNTIKYLVWMVFILVVIYFLRKLIRRRISDTSVRYRAQKGVEMFGYFLIILLSISYITGNVKNLTLIIGLLSAGIAFTLQELILSIAGSIYIFVLKVYKPGDRIEINGIKGDVIDIDTIYTTMMEIGQWVNSDNYSGRIVKLSNAFVFKGPIYNYSQDFPFIWDEINFPIRYGSDMELAKKIILNAASETLEDYVKNSESKWRDIVNKYYIEDAIVNSTVAVTLTDNWTQFNLRYIVDYKKRRMTKNTLHEKIGNAIQATDGKVKLASATFEIVDVPEFKMKKDY